LFWLSFILLMLLGAFIAYQDFKTRLISLWLIIAFGIVNIGQYLVTHSGFQLLENSIFCLCYFLFSYGVILLFYYVKNKKFEKIIDVKIGWGDLLIFLLIGFCIEPIHLIYFFTAGFIFSALFYILFLRKKQNVPLAGLLVIFYLVYIVYTNINFFY